MLKLKPTNVLNIEDSCLDFNFIVASFNWLELWVYYLVR